MIETAPDMLADVGRALHGERWQTALAHDLEVADRTVRRWIAGDTAPPPGVWRDLIALVEAWRMALARLLERLDRAATMEETGRP